MAKRILILTVAAAALAAVVATYAAGAAWGQTPTPSDNDVNRVARQLYCPVCQNVPLDVCPTDACAEWRADIRDRLAAGWSDQQIMDYFVAKYGERVLSNPSTHGLNLLIWLVPPIVVAGGVVFWWQFLRRAAVRPARAEAPAAPPQPADPYVAELEKELDERR